jgi:molybdate transport system ATP-binding protein
MAEAADSVRIAVQLARGAFRLDVDLCLPARGISVVFGPSGCGKSTLLRAIAGLEPATRGHIEIGGQCWQDEHHLLPPHQRAVGMVFQHAALLPHLSVEGNLRYGWRRAGSTEAVLRRWIETLGLAALLSRKPASLSGGERQRVALARALVTQPRCLLLDEPLSALDLDRRAEILPLLETIRREAGIPMLYVTHSIDEAVRLADHLVLLEAGQVRASGAALDILNHPDVPPLLAEDAGVVVEARVRARDAHGLLALTTAAGPLWVHAAVHPDAAPIRVRIRARDVSLTLSRHEDSSVLNLLPATVVTITPAAHGQRRVQLDANGQMLLALISQRSLEHLQLQSGMSVWAQIKAAALLA